MSDWVINPEEVVRLIPDMGTGIVSLSIMRGDAPVGQMRRDEPSTAEDSGWSFIGLGDSQELVDDPDNAVVCDLNTLANIDTDIISHLNRPQGVVLARDAADTPLSVIEGPDEPPSVVFLPPVSGETRLSAGWGIAIPGHCLRRVEDGNLVIWRPGLTFWLAIMNGEDDPVTFLNTLQGEWADGDNSALKTHDGWASLTYPMQEEDGGVSSRFHAVSADQHLMIAAYEDAEEQTDTRLAFDSVVRLLE